MTRRRRLSIVPSERHSPKSYSEIRRVSRARQAAVADVKLRGRGKSREELHAMLELARRGATADPVWIEWAIDHLWDTKVDMATLAAQALQQLGKLGFGLAKALRTGQLPDPSAPKWLEPPLRASYELPRGDRWIAVELDADVGDWLHRLHAAVPRIFGTAFNFKAWLSWDPEPRQPGSRLSVFVGDRRVGVVSQTDTTAYIAAMDAAEFREELPSTEARLTSKATPSKYLLELATPRMSALRSSG